MTKVTVLMPLEAAEGVVAQGALSVLAQDHQDVELILLSKDGFNYRKHLIGQGIEDARIKLAFVQDDEDAVNVGLEKMKGDAVIVLEQGDIMHTNRLSKMLGSLDITGVVVDDYIGEVDETEISTLAQKGNMMASHVDGLKYAPFPLIVNSFAPALCQKESDLSNSRLFLKGAIEISWRALVLSEKMYKKA